MIDVKSLPKASMLMESIRSVGYTFESAIADLVDNSITAKAKKINIVCVPSEKPVIYIYDDGNGMNDNELEEAMRLGSSDPLEKRNENDLGRFGLGLKTASFSQCKNLTVASKFNGKISAYRWDLEYLKTTNDWSLQKLEVEDINNSDFKKYLSNNSSGTCIALKEFDKIEITTNDMSKTMTNLISNLESHLALVFHRYIEDGLEININNRPIDSIDPFLKFNNYTQPLQEKIIYYEGSQIRVKPYILPHMNQISIDELSKVGGKEDLRKNQGFYVYRNKRLIIWGTWFKLRRQEELGKNARVIVEIPNSLDDIWQIDVKKSSAMIPEKIKQQLYKTVEDSIGTSINIYKHKILKRKKYDCIWNREESKDGCEYKVNRDLITIKNFKETLSNEQIKMFDRILKDIEHNFPFDAAYADTATGKAKSKQEFNDDDTNEKIIELEEILNSKSKEDIITICKVYLKMEGYGDNEKIKKFIEEYIEKCKL